MCIYNINSLNLSAQNKKVHFLLFTALFCRFCPSKFVFARSFKSFCFLHIRRTKWLLLSRFNVQFKLMYYCYKLSTFTYRFFKNKIKLASNFFCYLHTAELPTAVYRPYHPVCTESNLPASSLQKLLQCQSCIYLSLSIYTTVPENTYNYIHWWLQGVYPVIDTLNNQHILNVLSPRIFVISYFLQNSFVWTTGSVKYKHKIFST